MSIHLGKEKSNWEDYFYDYDFSDYIYDYFDDSLSESEMRSKRDTLGSNKSEPYNHSAIIRQNISRPTESTTKRAAPEDKPVSSRRRGRAAKTQSARADASHAFKVHPLIGAVNYMCLFYFTLEVIVRFIFCPDHIRFFMKPLNIIDIIAIVPNYALLVINSLDAKEYYTETAWDSLSVFGIIRVFRIFRMMKQYTGLQVLVYTLRYSIQEILLLVVFMCIGMVLFSSIMYFAEKGNTASEFPNIFAGFWWAVVTMTTVGYGDMVPQTGLGYLVGFFSAVCGVLVVALTVPVLVSNFELFYTFVRSRPININVEDKMKNMKINQHRRKRLPSRKQSKRKHSGIS